MMKYFIFVLITTSIIISCALSISDDKCTAYSNKECETCLNVSGCAYCKTDKQCFESPLTPITDKCKASDLQLVTCFANSQTLTIILGSVGGVILIGILIIVCCIRRKCKQRSLQNMRKAQDLNERQLEERQAAAQARSAERSYKDDQIRLKYGLMNGKDTSVGYKRMS